MERPPVRTTPRRSTAGSPRTARTVPRVRRLAHAAAQQAQRRVATTRVPLPSFGRPSFGGGVPQYGPTPPMPAPRRRNPLRFVALFIILALVALGGLVISGLSSGSSTVAYQNDDYQVPPPDRTRRRSRYPRRTSKPSSGSPRVRSTTRRRRCRCAATPSPSM